MILVASSDAVGRVSSRVSLFKSFVKSVIRCVLQPAMSELSSIWLCRSGSSTLASSSGLLTAPIKINSSSKMASGKFTRACVLLLDNYRVLFLKNLVNKSRDMQTYILYVCTKMVIVLLFIALVIVICF